MFILYFLLFLFLFSLVSFIRLIIRARSQFRESKKEKLEGEITIISDGSKRRKISASLGKYVDFKESKNK